MYPFGSNCDIIVVQSQFRRLTKCGISFLQLQKNVRDLYLINSIFVLQNVFWVRSPKTSINRIALHRCIAILIKKLNIIDVSISSHSQTFFAKRDVIINSLIGLLCFNFKSIKLIMSVQLFKIKLQQCYTFNDWAQAV